MLAGYDDRSRVGWIALGAVLAAVLGFVAVVFLGTVVFGLFLYYATRPLHRRIDRRVGQPTVAALLSLLALALPVVLLGAYTLAVAVGELGKFASETDLGPYASVLDPYLDLSAIVERPEALLRRIGDPDQFLALLESALTSLSAVGSGLLLVFVALSIAFYLLRDGHRLAGFVHLVDDDREVVATYWREVDRSLRDVFFGNILNAVLTGVIGAIAFSLLNLLSPSAVAIPYPALLGVLAGAGSLVPVVGMKIVYVPLVGYLAASAWLAGTGWGFVALVTAVSVVVVDFVPDILLRPYVSGGGLHTGTVMFAYVLGPVIFGWYGLFLGPLVLVVTTHFVRLVLPELLSGRPLDDTAADFDRLGAADGTDQETEASPDDDSPTDTERAESVDDPPIDGTDDTTAAE